MSSKINRTLIKKYALDVGDFYFYENYMVAEVKEGIAISFENATEMLKLGKLQKWSNLFLTHLQEVFIV